MHGRASERWDYKWWLKIDMLNHVECHSTWYIRVLNLNNLAYPTMYVSEFSVQETIHTVSSDRADLTHADRSHLDFLEIWAWTKDCHRIIDGYPGETWDTFITGPKTGPQVLCILVESDKKMQTFFPMIHGTWDPMHMSSIQMLPSLSEGEIHLGHWTCPSHMFPPKWRTE